MTPFRWNIERREQLGSLIKDIKPSELSQNDFLFDLRTAAARILALADNADLAFVGRTPENFYDYLSGILAQLDQPPRLHLIHFSMRWAGPGGMASLDAEKRKAFFDYLVDEGIDAMAIGTSPRPLALVDYVAEGGTMENLIRLLKMQAESSSVDWNAVQRKLQIIGLRIQTHNSPNTWRWQQNQNWLHLIPDIKIKNVSIPGRFLYYIANTQPKVTSAHHPNRWHIDASASADAVTPAQQEALALAVQLYDLGRSRDERTALSAEIASTHQMRQAATRRLVSKLRTR